MYRKIKKNYLFTWFFWGCLILSLTSNLLFANINNLKEKSSTTLYLPHIATTYGWETKLICDNNDEEPNSITINIYKDGELIKEETYTIEAQESLNFIIDEGDCGIITHTGNNFVVRVSYIHIEEKGIAEFVLDNNSSNKITFLMPQYLSEKLTWMGLAIMNPNQEQTTINLTALDKNGNTLDTATLTLNSHSRFAAVLKNIFTNLDNSSSNPFEDPHTYKDIAQVVAESDLPVCGINISGIENKQLLFTQAIANSSSPKYLYLPHIATNFSYWKNYLIFDNIGDQDSSALIKLYSNGELVLNNYNVSIPAHNSVTINLNNFSNLNVECGIIECQTNTLKVRIAYVNNVNGTAEFTLSGCESLSNFFLFPEYAKNMLTWMGSALFNPSGNDASVTLKAYKDGNEIASTTIEIPAYSRKADVIENFFPALSTNDVVKIEAISNQPITGINISGSGQERLLFTKSISNNCTNNNDYLFYDGFENNNAGDAPNGWEFRDSWGDTGTIRVTDNLSSSGSKSLKVEGNPGWCQGVFAPNTFREENVSLKFDVYLPTGNSPDQKPVYIMYGGICVWFVADENGGYYAGIREGDASKAKIEGLQPETWYSFELRVFWDNSTCELICGDKTTGIVSFDKPDATSGWGVDISLYGNNSANLNKGYFDEIYLAKLDYLFYDGFENNNAGDAPNGWEFRDSWGDTGTIRVTDNLSSSGSKSLKVEGNPGWCQGVFAPNTFREENVSLKFDVYLPTGNSPDQKPVYIMYGGICVWFVADENGGYYAGIREGDASKAKIEGLQPETWYSFELRVFWDNSTCELICGDKTTGIVSFDKPDATSGWGVDISLYGNNSANLNKGYFDEIYLEK